MTQARRDAITGCEMRIREEEGAIRALAAMGQQPTDFDMRVALSELARYQAWLDRLTTPSAME